MRIRSIKPDFWRSADISGLALEDRLLFIGIWSYVDDNGVGIDRLALVAADLFADDMERDPPETLARVSRGLSKLFSTGLIHRYKAENRALLCVVNWDKHQRVDKPNKARYPRPDVSLTSDYGDSRESVAESSRESRESLAPGTGEQGNRGTESKSVMPRNGAATKTTQRGTRLDPSWMPDPELIAEMRAECPTIDLQAEHRKFVDFWTAKSGKDATKLDWRRTWRNWIRNARPTNGSPKPRNQQETEAWLDRAMQRAIEADEADDLKGIEE